MARENPGGGSLKRWTDEGIRAIKVPEGQRDAWVKVDGALSVYARPDARGVVRKQWIYRGQVNGARKAIAIGPYPSIGLAEARKRAAELFAEAAQARTEAAQHPVVVRKSERAERLAEPTVSEFFAEFIEATRQGRRSRGGRPSGSRTIELLTVSFCTDIEPVIGEMKLGHVTRADCETCLARPIERYAERMARRPGGRAGSATAGGRGAAAGVYKVLRGLFAYADDREVIEANPMRRVKNPKPQRPPDTIRAATDDELRRLLTAMRESSRLSASARLAIVWQLLTGSRPGEARLARWDQIDEQGRRWRLNAADKKERRPFVQILSDEAMAVLKEAEALRRPHADALLFPSPTAAPEGAAVPMERASVNHALRRACEAAGIESMSGHDLRRTTRTLMARIGIDDAVAERCMAHKFGGTLAATYNAHAYIAEMAAAWAKVGAHIDALMAGGAEVVPLRAAGGA